MQPGCPRTETLGSECWGKAGRMGEPQQRRRWGAKEKLTYVCLRPSPWGFVQPLLQFRPGSCPLCHSWSATPAAAGCRPAMTQPQQPLGHKPPPLKPVNTQQKRGEIQPAFLFFQTSHRRQWDSSCEQNGLLLSLYFLYKGSGFRSISVSLPSLTAQVWFPPACQFSCVPTSHHQACRSCERSKFGHCRSKVTTHISKDSLTLLEQESRCDLSNCQPCRINQRDENPLCHSSPLIKVLPEELSSQFRCWCTRREVTWFTLAEPLWLCHAGATKSLNTSEMCTGMASSYIGLVALPELCRR